MGKVNLLKADYTGKVGSTYGVRQYRQSIVKATPFSHAPHNTAQTRAVRAFEKLNRVSSFIAKKFWSELNLSSKTMYKHNAVARWLKPVVKNNSFALANIVEVIPSNDTLRIDSCDFDFDNKEVTLHFTNEFLSPLTETESIFCALVTDSGVVKGGGAYSPASQTLSFQWDFTDFLSLSVILFKSSHQGKKKIINGFCIESSVSEYVTNGILYTSRMPWTTAPIFADGIIHFNSADAQLINEILHFVNA